MIALSNDIWSLTLSAERGGAILSGTCHNVPVFEPARPVFHSEGDNFAVGCFPLVPFSNRIADGKFQFGERTYELTANHPHIALPIHGNGWEKSWTVTAQSRHLCELTLDYKTEPGSWPFDYKAVQKFDLQGDRLIVHLSLENTDQKAAPAGIGLHPFFANGDSARIRFDAQTFWDCGLDLIPTKPVAVSGTNDFREIRHLDVTRLDNCYGGWDGRAVIDWENTDLKLEMRADSIFSHLVVYIQPENPFFCLEPVSHVNNAMNKDSEQAMTILQPGQKLSGKVEFSPF